jgi:hypothetical protein
VRDVACIFVQQRDRRHELAQQAQRRVEIELKPRSCATRSISESRDAFDVVRHDGQSRGMAMMRARAR